MTRENEQVYYPTAVKVRPKPFLQAHGVPACILPYAFCSVLDKYCDFLSLFTAQGAETGGKSAPNS